jgi:hypothetical protein
MKGESNMTTAATIYDLLDINVTTCVNVLRDRIPNAIIVAEDNLVTVTFKRTRTTYHIKPTSTSIWIGEMDTATGENLRYAIITKNNLKDRLCFEVCAGWILSANNKRHSSLSKWSGRHIE